jgi:hypothetical protein
MKHMPPKKKPAAAIHEILQGPMHACYQPGAACAVAGSCCSMDSWRGRMHGVLNKRLPGRRPVEVGPEAPQPVSVQQSRAVPAHSPHVHFRHEQ